VQSVDRREGYQPPEGTEEIRAAIAMAERDPRLHDAVSGLQATAIVTYNPQFRGHRVLHVSFSPRGEDVPIPRFYALVDLTNASVPIAGPVAGAEGGIR